MEKNFIQTLLEFNTISLSFPIAERLFLFSFKDFYVA